MLAMLWDSLSEEERKKQLSYVIHDKVYDTALNFLRHLSLNGQCRPEIIDALLEVDVFEKYQGWAEIENALIQPLEGNLLQSVALVSITNAFKRNYQSLKARRDASRLNSIGNPVILNADMLADDSVVADIACIGSNIVNSLSDTFGALFNSSDANSSESNESKDTFIDNREEGLMSSFDEPIETGTKVVASLTNTMGTLFSSRNVYSTIEEESKESKLISQSNKPDVDENALKWSGSYHDQASNIVWEEDDYDFYDDTTNPIAPVVQTLGDVKSSASEMLQTCYTGISDHINEGVYCIKPEETIPLLSNRK